MARSRANSMASRHGSRAASQANVARQDVVADPTNFDFDFNNVDEWFNDEGLDLSGFDFNANANANTVGFANPFAPVVPPAHYVQQAPFDQYGHRLSPQYQAQYPMAPPMGGNIDPSLLTQQPYGLQAPTPGLTAVPGEANFTQQYPTQYSDPSMFMLTPQPYYQPFQQTGYTPMEQPAIQQAHQEAPAPARRPNKRALSTSGSEDEAPNPKRRRDQSSSPEIVKRPRRQSRDSGFSTESSLGAWKGPNIPQAGQTPLKSANKPWVRVNNNTKGETTRTARINAEMAQQTEDNKYKCKPLPNGNWKSKKFEFEYVTNSNLDEFKQKKMSARQITDYISQYPTDDLRLWLQVAPADMARRYASPAHSKCLFEDCPKHTWGDSGTIDVGHYRVAFDEKFKVYGHNNKSIDPFDCPGFVHLYCLERFCNFEKLCNIADIEVDARVDLPRELSQAKWTLSGRPEIETARRFIKACKKGEGNLRTLEEFAQYPVHVSSHQSKAFDGTLVSVLSDINIDARTRSQMRQFIERKLTPNVLMINRGDMEIAMTQKKIKHSKVYKKAIKTKCATAASFDFEAYYDEYDPAINQRIAKYRDLNARYDAEEEAGTARHRSKKAAPKRKRAAVVHDDSDEDESDTGYAGPSRPRPAHGRRRRQQAPQDSDSGNDVQEYVPRTGTRVSPRNSERVNYAQDEQQQQHQPNQRPAQPSYIPEDYRPASPGRRESLSNFFPNIRQDDPNYDQQRGPSVEEMDTIMNFFYDGLARRKSSTASSHGRFHAGIVKPRSPRARSGRQASFAAHPVSSEQEYHVNDPPSQLVATPSAQSPTRRSTRIARSHHQG